ncbi:MAG: hypothetical protein MKZ58_07315 [Candidatus Poseidoniaceae archaeon]|nr:hypothetical protein [Candidatus Poseidoniaceae archaeon]HIH58060.1 methylmalonyl Co-A mutase-associated GTPase MeaB [Candidatus Poseidoniaceae archaeon]
MDRRTLARQLSAIENGEMKVESYVDGDVIAITGPPGVGKSCIVDSILHRLAPAKNIAVLAVDPTSPLSGGALLGDRIRLSVLDDKSKSDSIYVRSVATRSSSGSIPSIIRDLASHLLVNNFDLVIIETVGAGQAEMRCAAIANRIVVVEGPARGDGIQAEKAGLLELADLIVVNKSDLDGSDKVVNDLTISLGLTSDAPPILKTSAVTGEGLDDLSELITRLDERTSSKRARNRQQLLMAHENILTANPHFEAVLDRMSEEGLTLDAALRELNERPN